MKAYPLPACNGSSCNQGRAQCKTEAICNKALHRVTPCDIESREYLEARDDMLADYGKGAFIAAVLLVAFSIGVALALPDHYWPELVAALSWGQS